VGFADSVFDQYLLRIPEFQPKGPRRSLANAQNWFTDRKVTLTDAILPVVIGFGIGFGATVLGQKYLGDLPEKVKSFISSYLPTQNQQEQPVDNSQALYDYSLDVMRRQAGSN